MPVIALIGVFFTPMFHAAIGGGVNNTPPSVEKQGFSLHPGRQRAVTTLSEERWRPCFRGGGGV